MDLICNQRRGGAAPDGDAGVVVAPDAVPSEKPFPIGGYQDSASFSIVNGGRKNAWVCNILNGHGPISPARDVGPKKHALGAGAAEDHPPSVEIEDAERCIGQAKGEAGARQGEAWKPRMRTKTASCGAQGRAPRNSGTHARLIQGHP